MNINIRIETLVSAALLLSVLFLAVQAWRLRRRRVTVGPAAAGMMHELLNDDRRKAVEVIVEEKTAYCDPENADGNLPPARRRKP